MNYEPLITGFSADPCYFFPFYGRDLVQGDTGFLPRRFGFNPRVVPVRFVDKVAMAKGSLRTPRFSPADYNFTLAPHSSSIDR
jgi:hypothetical protein